MSKVIASSVIFSKSAINLYITFLDAVINTLYLLSFTHLIMLDLLKCNWLQRDSLATGVCTYNIDTTV